MLIYPRYFISVVLLILTNACDLFDLQDKPLCHTSRAAMADDKVNDCDGVVDDDTCVTTYGIYVNGTYI